MADLNDAPPPGGDLNRPLLGEDTGPQHIDADTVDAFRQLYAAGSLTFPPDVQPYLDRALDAADLPELTALFQREVRSAVTSGAPTVLMLRVLALYRALRSTAEQYAAGMTPTGGPTIPHPVQLIVAADGLAGYLQELQARHAGDFPPEGLAAVAMVSPRTLADVTGISENQWAVWRNRGLGPRFLKPTPRTVRYPLGAVLDWIRDNLPTLQAS